MPSGSCLCGEIRYELTGPPNSKVACHCPPCRKSAGPTGSVNFLVPEENYKITSGTPKQWTRKGDSGKDVIYNFCPTCGTYIHVAPVSLLGTIVLKPGTFDADQDIESAKPQTEIFVKDRVEWCPAVTGATQVEHQ